MSARETRITRHNEMTESNLENLTDKKKEQHRTTQAKKSFLEIFYDKSGNVYETCKSVDITRTTYYDWMKNDEAFKKAVIDIQEALIDFSESQLLSLIKSKNVTSVIFHLKTKGKERGYVETLAIGGDEKRPVRLILEEGNSNSPAKNNDKEGEK